MDSVNYTITYYLCLVISDHFLAFDKSSHFILPLFTNKCITFIKTIVISDHFLV
jgi:hypothetical protein